MKLTTKIYIQAVKWSWSDDFEVGASTVKRKSDANYVVVDIDETEIELSVPDFKQSDFTQAHIDQLLGLKEKLKADTHVKLKSLDEQIESLLAIEHKELDE